MLGEETTEIMPPQNAEELQAKMERVLDTIINFSKIEKETDRAVKQQFLEIYEDAERLKIDKDEQVRMLHESLHGRGSRAAKISESYLRKLLSPAAKASLDESVKQK